ncbi:acyltransferase family protein [Neobacillus ginsengisoli]|uniref:Fucose 4-O-acetylase-like acetyltransferase n=1 Tax=Neobacillus ginsengisoli TaxID=904295 RepID=A0ABT9XUI1_9BACI|nr:acyltransferase family protein [Neobacillus ginsengisoli]MDQ0199219.1 fucose 4-O-acetylase-like acetyltransferase [Neobacillus ginsengisoli]
MTSSSRRSLYFDNAKFFLIFLVVFGHVISPIKDNNNILFTLYSVIFLFHMPAFIFISGYFSKGFNKKGYLLKILKKILLPYLIFQVLYSLFYYLDGEVPSLKVDMLQPHWSLWFLLSLFCWNLFLYIFARLKWTGLVISIAIGVGIGYFDHVGSFLSLSRTLVFFPYFLLGYLVEPKHLKIVKKARFSPLIGFAILLGTALVFAALFPKGAMPWLFGDTSYANMGVKELTSVLKRSSQYLVTLIVTYGFLAMVPTKGFKFTIIGERTLYVYLLHGFIIKTIEMFVSYDTLNGFSTHYVILTVFSLVICFLLGSFFIKKYTCPLVEMRIFNTKSLLP